MVEHEDDDNRVENAPQQECQWLHNGCVVGAVQPQAVKERPKSVRGLDLVSQPNPELCLNLDRSKLKLLEGLSDLVFEFC